MSNHLKITTMKKIYTFILLAMTSMMTLTSCEADLEDRMEARTLEGTWTGNIENYYYDRWGLTGNSYRTALYFERENAYGGWGYEVDYDARRPSDYWYCDFKWEVIRGNIHITYYDRDYTDVVIYDYMLDDYYFSGDIDDGYSDTRTHFNLSYDNTFNWNYWRHATTRGTSDDEYHAVSSGCFAKE